MNEFFVCFQEIKSKIIGWLFKLQTRSMTRTFVRHLAYELLLSRETFKFRVIRNNILSTSIFKS